MDFQIIDLNDLFVGIEPIPDPKAAPELVQLATGFVPFVQRIEPWARGRLFDRAPEVFTAPQRWFHANWPGIMGGEFAGWYSTKHDNIVIAEPWRDQLWDRSVVLHETVHWMQMHADDRLHAISRSESELEAWRVQMIWYAGNGGNVREHKAFNPANIRYQTSSDELFADDYAWLKQHERSAS